jgi:hypothetical protein
VFPEIGFEGFRLRHAALPVFRRFISAALRNLLYAIINFPSRQIKTEIKPGNQAAGKPKCRN